MKFYTFFLIVFLISNGAFASFPVTKNIDNEKTIINYNDIDQQQIALENTSLKQVVTELEKGDISILLYWS